MRQLTPVAPGCQESPQNSRQLREAALRLVRTLNGDLRAHRNGPASLSKENLSVMSVRSYGPKKSAFDLVWQQSCVAPGQSEHHGVAYIRCEMSMIVVNIITVIGHNMPVILALTTRQFRSSLRRMAKELTVREMARMGGLARAKAHSKAQIRAWGKQGGRPHVLSRTAQARLVRMLRDGKTQAECAAILQVSVRSIGRFVSEEVKS